MNVVITGIPLDSATTCLIDLIDRSVRVNDADRTPLQPDQASAIRKVVKELLIQVLPKRTTNQTHQSWPFLAPLRYHVELDAFGTRASLPELKQLRTILRREACDRGVSVEELVWTLFRLRDVNLVTQRQIQAFLDWTQTRYYRHQMDLVLEQPDPLPEEVLNA